MKAFLRRSADLWRIHHWDITDWILIGALWVIILGAVTAGFSVLADEMMSGPATRPTPKRLEGIDVAAAGPVG